MFIKFLRRTSYLIVFSLIVSVFLYGCGTESEEGAESSLLNIPNSTDYTHVFIQGVDENGGASEGEFISDETKVETFISKIDQIEIVKPPSKEIELKSKELNQKGNYIIALTDSESLDNKAYSMTFFQDGSIYFPSSDESDLTYMSKEKSPELLKEIKELLGIAY